MKHQFVMEGTAKVMTLTFEVRLVHFQLVEILNQHI